MIADLIALFLYFYIACLFFQLMTMLMFI